MPTLMDHFKRALRLAVADHGAPNTFGAAELASLYGAPSPQYQGQWFAVRFNGEDGAAYEARKAKTKTGRLRWVVALQGDRPEDPDQDATKTEVLPKKRRSPQMISMPMPMPTTPTLQGVNVNITDLEIQVLSNIAESDYQNGADPTNFEDLGGVWAWDLTFNLQPAQVPGVVSSLSKKGLVECSGTGKDAAVSMTRSGHQAYLEHRNRARCKCC